jgi:hypothetical protein
MATRCLLAAGQRPIHVGASDGVIIRTVKLDRGRGTPALVEAAAPTELVGANSAERVDAKIVDDTDGAPISEVQPVEHSALTLPSRPLT